MEQRHGDVGRDGMKDAEHGLPESRVLSMKRVVDEKYKTGFEVKGMSATLLQSCLDDLWMEWSGQTQRKGEEQGKEVRQPWQDGRQVQCGLKLFYEGVLRATKGEFVEELFQRAYQMDRSSLVLKLFAKMPANQPKLVKALVQDGGKFTDPVVRPQLVHQVALGIKGNLDKIQNAIIAACQEEPKRMKKTLLCLIGTSFLKSVVSDEIYGMVDGLLLLDDDQSRLQNAVKMFLAGKGFLNKPLFLEHIDHTSSQGLDRFVKTTTLHLNYNMIVVPMFAIGDFGGERLLKYCIHLADTLVLVDSCLNPCSKPSEALKPANACIVVDTIEAALQRLPRGEEQRHVTELSTWILYKLGLLREVKTPVRPCEEWCDLIVAKGGAKPRVVVEPQAASGFFEIVMKKNATTKTTKVTI